MKYKYLVHGWVFIKTLIAQFRANGGIVNASALTYTTLFAVVPLMTVTYSVLALVPTFQGVGDSVQGWIFSNFVPATGEVVQSYLKDFTAQASKLTAVGVIFLFVTSVMMMKSIEAAFNRIWRVKYSRKGMSSFLLYWAILSLGPILIGLGLLISSYIASLSFVSEATAIIGRSNLLLLLPVTFSIAAFSLLYSAVPNCRVPFKNALIGAVVVAILFEIAKRAFAMFAVQFPSYKLIYGAFAAVPLFLVWIFITWIIILLGAELTRLLTVYNTSASGGFQSNLHTVVGVLRKLWQAQRQGIAVSDEILLASVAGLNQQRWDEYQQLLLDAQIICRTEQGEYILARDLNVLSLEELKSILPWPVPNPSLEEHPESWISLLDTKLTTLKEHQYQLLNVPIQSLFESNDSKQ
ncbi:MAG: YihY family inner membrane protein [Oceanospirillaceae bacterium]|nr:YihY family inner membrane protein [Oceanospirillaceae bacterium]